MLQLGLQITRGRLVGLSLVEIKRLPFVASVGEVFYRGFGLCAGQWSEKEEAGGESFQGVHGA